MAGTYPTISSAIFTVNLPTLVPPNFWISQGADGSILFWCKLGGVLGGDIDPKDDVVVEGGDADGVEKSDIANRAETRTGHPGGMTRWLFKKRLSTGPIYPGQGSHFCDLA